MREQLEKKSLLTVTIEEDDVLWIKKEKEIWVNNRMFDIKYSRHENGAYTFTGLYDNDETMLVKQLHKSQQEENNAGNKMLLQLFRLLQTPCIHQPDIFFPGIGSAFLYWPTVNTSLPSQYIAITTPPPQA